MDYKKIYNQVCQRAKKESSVRIERRKLWKSSKGSEGTYYESHHIIPRCLMGEGKPHQWKHENIVLLTAREHFICHWLLHEIYPDNPKLAIAFNLMCLTKNSKQSRYKPSSRIIKYAKEIDKKAKFGSTSPWKGKSHSEKAKQKIRLSKIGKKHTKETIQKLRNIFTGRKIENHWTKTEEGRLRISQWTAGDKNPSKIPEVREKISRAKKGKKNPKMAEYAKTRVGELNSFYGKTHSDEFKEMMRELKTGVPLTEQHKISLSIAMKNRLPYDYKNKQQTCPYCGLTGGGGNMKRYHFDNCKSLKK